jgi:hypothetical protein
VASALSPETHKTLLSVPAAITRPSGEEVFTKRITDKGRVIHLVGMRNGGKVTHLWHYMKPLDAKAGHRYSGEAHPLARAKSFRQDGPSAAEHTALTDNHQKHREIALKVLAEAGLTPAAVRTVLAHEEGKGVRSTVIQAIQKRVSPEMARYVAAWWGLLSREKAVTVFHPDESGEDFLHVITSRVPADEMGDLLKQAGVPSFSVERAPSGSRVYVFNPQNKLADPIRRVAEATHASHSAHQGFGYRLGASQGADADARAQYRGVISDYESTVGARPQTNGPGD